MTALQRKAQELLQSGAVDVVLGWRVDPESERVKPHVFRKDDKIEELVFDDRCVHNLVTFLTDIAGRHKRTGIVLKGCDGRALATLLIEKRLKCESVHAIAVACDGVKIDGKDAAKCADCATNVAPVADTVIGERKPACKPEYKALEFIEKLAPAERWEFFARQFERCNRCYSCRQACPMCYCETCIAEQTEPAWIDLSTKLSANTMWQLSRAYHLAGRCADCGECERACPERLPLRLLNLAIEKLVVESFGVRPGTDPTAEPPLLKPAETDSDALLGGKR
jgi:formate dehydrogenase (coenzyme F420) beta subunit